MVRLPPSAYLATLVAQLRWPSIQRPAKLVPKRILIIRLNRLGDLICALPVYRSLETSLPHAEIDWLLSSQNCVLAPFLRPRGQIVTIQKSIGRYFLKRDLIHSLQTREYDLAIALKGGYDSSLAWIALASGARERRGFLPDRKPFLSFAFNKPFPLPPTHNHQVEKGLALVKDLISRESDDISLNLPSSARQKASQFLADHRVTGSYVIFQISSTKRSFCQWPADHFAELGKRFASSGIRICINALPVDFDRANRLSHEIGPSATVIMLPEMDGYLAFLERAKIVIGADGGGIHLAAAMKARTVAIYAESHPDKWRPWHSDHIEFYTANRDVREVTPAKVWEEISRKNWL